MMTALIKRFLEHRGGVALIEFAIVFPVFFLLLFGGIEINRLILIQQKLEKAGYVIGDIVTQYTPATTRGLAGEINVNEITTRVFPQLNRMMGIYSEPARQVAILTAVRVSGPTAGRTLTIDWQIAGGGNMTSGTCDGLASSTCARSIVNGIAPSAISVGVRGTRAFSSGSAESAAARALILGLPQQPSASDYTIIVNEVFYFYQSLLGSLVGDMGAAGGGGIVGYNFGLPPKMYVKRTYFIPRNESHLFDLPPTFPVR